MRIALLHARYTLIETARVPIAVMGAVVFPALTLLFFVLPQRAIAEDSGAATRAVASLAVFAVLNNALFSFALSIAQDREQPWDPYLRTLPVRAASRVFGHVLASAVLGVAAVIPVVVLGALLTAARATPLGLVGAAAALVVAGIPFALAGICIGYAMTSRGASAIVQVVMFGLAFGGGLFFQPTTFAPWLDAVSRVLPSRQARDLVVFAVQGGTLDLWTWIGIVAWSAALLALALVLYRRDEGRRFR
ncbi:MAG: ABC transporter permease [Rhodoglobus sp.]